MLQICQLQNGCFEDIHEQCTIPVFIVGYKFVEATWPDVLLLY